VPTKFATDRPFADPEKAARQLLELANAAEAVQEGRIHIELINLPFCASAAAPMNTARVSNERSPRAG
jgi:hypothetical protein